MPYKILSFIAVIAFVSSIAFSFYFSQLIVEYNSTFQTNQTLQNKLRLQQQALLSNYLSLTGIKPTDFPELQPITNIQNLSP
ncbi:MAG: hypothetical protein NTY75_03130 [Candidatus Shapirobacteria bacterium]|nr:hypothetical protein [Candidatus Shapirobacteria bacterium]